MGRNSWAQGLIITVQLPLSNTHHALGPLLNLLLTFKAMLSRVNYHPQFREEETASLRGSEHTQHLTTSRWQDQNLNLGLSGPQATPPPFQCSIPQVRALRSGVGKGACPRRPPGPLQGLSIPRRGSTETLTIPPASRPCLLQPRSPAAPCGVALGQPLLSESHFPPLWESKGARMRRCPAQTDRQV